MVPGNVDIQNGTWQELVDSSHGFAAERHRYINLLLFRLPRFFLLLAQIRGAMCTHVLGFSFRTRMTLPGASDRQSPRTTRERPVGRRGLNASFGLNNIQQPPVTGASQNLYRQI